VVGGGIDSTFLTSALDRICQLDASAAVLPVKSPGTHWRFCGPLYASEKSKICCSRQELKRRSIGRGARRVVPVPNTLSELP
jgi:hypothetical protein